MLARSLELPLPLPHFHSTMSHLLVAALRLVADLRLVPVPVQEVPVEAEETSPSTTRALVLA